jgi:hypothetical protein
MTNHNPRFPITLTPGVPLAPVLVRRNADADPDEIPEEFVLRQLGDADLDDDATVAAILDEFGAVDRPFYDPGAVPAGARGRLVRSTARERLTYGWWSVRADGTLEDARWWLRTARALAGMWREASTDGEPAGAWQAEGFTMDTEQSAWAMFAVAMNIALAATAAHVEYTPADYNFTFGVPVTDLYGAAAIQVFNLLATQAVARRCENRTCGRVFVHQLGGAKFRQHRSIGLRFCTPECARAETQRQYRRRKAALKKEQDR